MFWGLIGMRWWRCELEVGVEQRGCVCFGGSGVDVYTVHFGATMGRACHVEGSRYEDSFR